MTRKRIFFVDAAAHNTKDFEAFASLASKLKSHGRVDMNVGSVAAKTSYDIPQGGSPWHEYTSTISAMRKFFPVDKVAAFVPSGEAARNRAYMESCAKILRQYDLSAGYHGSEPFFVDERFFEAHPHLRGPRVDHPRRSKIAAYTWCIDQPETQDIVSAMVAQLAAAVPQLSSLSIHTNDSGSGMCWNDNLYTGPNGPARCRDIDTGQRIATFANAIYRGAGRKIDIHMRGTFSPLELRSAPTYLDESFILELHRGGPQTARIGTFGDNPVMGAVDPVAIIKTLESWSDAAPRMVSVRFFMNYFRGPDHVSAAQKVVEVVDRYLSEPRPGTVERFSMLRGLCAGWVGEQQADALLEALVEWHEALVLREVTLPQFNCNYTGVSLRHITRPLVIMPDRLSAEEESYFLPHVFNPNETEGRMDYLDYHGMRLRTNEVSVGLVDPRLTTADRIVTGVSGAAERLERLDGDGSDVAFFRDMGKSLRIYASVMRSIHNFYMVQVMRDRNVHKLSAPPIVHPKVHTRTGDPDNFALIACMRDELDNTTDLIDLLVNGDGLKQVFRAPTPELEDTFLLGPDIVDQLRKKVLIMRRHWRDMDSAIASRA